MAKQSNNSKLITLKAEADQLAANKKQLEELFALENKIDQAHFDRIESLQKENKELEKSKKQYDNLLKQQAERQKLLKAELKNFDDIEDSLVSIGNKMGKTSGMYQVHSDRANQIKKTTASIGTILAANTDLSQKQEEAIVAATKAYGNTQTSIQKVGLALSKNNITQSEYNNAIKQSYEEFENLIDAIDDSTESGKELRDILIKGREEMESFAKAAERSADRLEQVNTALDTFGSSGIPMAGQMSDVFKKMANKDIPGVKAGLVALGAAAGALAMNYFGAPMQVAIETYYDKQQNLIDGARELAKIGVEKGFIDRKGTNLDKIGLEIIQSQIDSRNELNRLENERNFASERASNQFNATMKSNAVEFQAAAKTGLFGNSIGGVGYAAGQLQLAGIGADQIASAMTAASDATGKMPTGKMGSDMAVMAARTGQSAEGIASINEAFQRMDGLSADTAMNMQEGLRSMAKQANINLGGLMSEMAESSKDMLGYQIKSGSALAKQVTFARSMGVSFQDIAKAGQSMVLNYKDSIKSEMQLSAMLGKNVDLSEVRSKFASGDTEGALKALKSQGLDPANMDMFQQQMLQQATGMDLTTLSKINKNTGASVGLSAGNAKAGNQSFLSRTQSAQQTLSSQQAIISADQAIIDAQLSQKITESYLNSPGYLTYQKELAMQQENQAKLNTLIQKALLDSPALQALKAKEKKLNTERGFGENALSAVGGVAGGLLTNKLLPKAAGVAGAAGGGGGGLLSKAGGFLGKAGGGILGKAGGLLGKVAAPLMIAKGLYDGFKGFTADKDASMGDKFKNAGSSVLNGLTFGLLGKDADTIKAESIAKKGVAPAQVAAVTPGNASVVQSAKASEKWLQDKLKYMSGNLERVVDRTHKTMMNTAATTKELQTLNTNTKALVNLTTRIEALTAATYQGKGDVQLKIDGKTVAYSFNKYKENTINTNPAPVAK